MNNKQLIKKLEQACQVCRDCGFKYGVYSVGCSSVWEGVCDVCDETKGVTEARDYGYLVTGIRKLKVEDEAKSRPFSELTKDFSPERKTKIKEQSKRIAKQMLTQEPLMTDEDLDRVMNPSYKRGPMTNHPVTPPPELVREWQREANHNEAMFPQVAAQAARWGADAELEACLEWISKQDWTWTKTQLREARRPQPPSLKEQALALLDTAQESDDACNSWNFDTIRRALEALPND